MAAGQLPPDRGPAAGNSRGLATALLPYAARVARPAAGWLAAQLWRGLGLCGPHRQRVRRLPVGAFSECLPRRARTHPRRAVGAAHHLARGVGGEPAPLGRPHCQPQGGARTGQPVCQPHRHAQPGHRDRHAHSNAAARCGPGVFVAPGPKSGGPCASASRHPAGAGARMAAPRSARSGRPANPATRGPSRRPPERGQRDHRAAPDWRLGLGRYRGAHQPRHPCDAGLPGVQSRRRHHPRHHPARH